MNHVYLYEQGYIPFSELAVVLWDFGQNTIFEIGEDCFRFYCDKVNVFHDYDYYIRRYTQVIDVDFEPFYDILIQNEWSAKIMSDDLKELLESMFILSETVNGGYMIERDGGNDEMPAIMEFESEKDLIDNYAGKSATVMLEEFKRDVGSQLDFDDDEQYILEDTYESMLDLFEDLETILETYTSKKK